jgi:predicted DsbA family dithiol-disulfide isomerase
METLRIDVWSDIACPWCWVGKRRLEGALERFAHAGDVAVVWRAFELDPSAPKVRDDGLSYAARLGKKYGTSAAQAELMIQRMTDTAAKDGITMRFDRARPGNTFDAHRLLHLAGERGRQGELKERLFRAYLGEGEAIGDHATLARLAGEVGLDLDEVAATLASDAYAKEVRADEREAAGLGVSGVPFFAFAGRYGVSGAQPVDALLQVLDRAWDEAAGEEIAAEGAVCGPAGCT